MASRQHRKAPGFVAPTLLGVLLLAIWWAASASAGLSPFLLPSPGAVVGRLAANLASPAYWPYILNTLAETLLGCLAGAAIALPLSVLIHRWRLAADAIGPYLGATQAIPAIALAPLLVLWIGYGLSAIVALCALIVFFPILISSVVGLRHVDSDVVDAARIDGADGWGRLLHVEFPMALPSVLAGLRNGFSLSVTGAVVGEMVMGGRGLGTVLTVQRDAVDTAGMFATILILALIASGAYLVISAFERRSQTIDALLKEKR